MGRSLLRPSPCVQNITLIIVSLHVGVNVSVLCQSNGHSACVTVHDRRSAVVCNFFPVCVFSLFALELIIIVATHWSRFGKSSTADLAQQYVTFGITVWITCRHPVIEAMRCVADWCAV